MAETYLAQANAATNAAVTYDVSYYEQKTFWSLCSYMVRSRKGIELLVNLINNQCFYNYYTFCSFLSSISFKKALPPSL